MRNAELRSRKLRDGENSCILSFGPIGNDVAEVIEEHGLNIGHYDMRFAKPLDTETIREVVTKYKRIITIEDGVKDGGFGSAVQEYINADSQTRRLADLELIRLGLPDEFIEHGSIAQLKKLVGLDKKTIYENCNHRG